MKRIKRIVKNWAERLFGVSIYRVLPRGIDPFYDLQRKLPWWKPDIIFDVGANTGQSVRKYAQKFPNSRIWSFEPCKDTYEKLRQNVAHFPNVECVRLALASAPGQRVLRYGQDSSLHTLRDGQTPGQEPDNGGHELVEVQTVDQFCRTSRIERISYLKIDTEGSDLEVLQGSEGFLGDHKVEVIETELGFCPDNDVHVPFQKVRDFLEHRSYFIFGFYEQTYEWKFRKAHLRRSNVVFISQDLDPLRT